MTIETEVNWLSEAAGRVAETNHTKGWFEQERSFGDLIALLHSEVSEILEAYRDYGTRDVTYDGVGEWTSGTVKPEGVGSECADTLIRLLDLCGRHGIDLHKEFERKMEYNATRPHRHGGKRL